ncbi:hypothetical protein BLJ79_06945 [Arthrobacter sp. UCD-GKA]|nr:hypothetical protein BLJ79_06945 [Arthrobacter sp. UCD-GKA]
MSAMSHEYDNQVKSTSRSTLTNSRIDEAAVGDRRLNIIVGWLVEGLVGLYVTALVEPASTVFHRSEGNSTPVACSSAR